MKFSINDLFSKDDIIQKTTDFVTFTEKFLFGKFHILYKASFFIKVIITFTGGYLMARRRNI